MADPLTVRLAETRDRAAWETLWRGWQAHMGGRVPDEVTARSWAKLIDPTSGIDCLMAFEGREALGFAIASRSFFAWTGEDIFYLQDLYVAEQARGRGAGSALLKELYAHADRTGARQVFWMVDEDDPELQGFYARHAQRTHFLRYMRQDWPW